MTDVNIPPSAGNTPVLSGNNTFTGNNGFGLLNNQLVVGPAAFRYTTIAAAQASSDCPAAGCTIFVRSDATLDASTVVITKPIHVVFDCASYTYSGTGSFMASTTGVESVHIDGCSRSTQAFTTGTVINITNTAALGFNMTNSPSMDIQYLTLKGPGSGTANGIYIGGTRPGMYKVLVDSFGNDGIVIDGSATNTNVGTFIHVRSSHNGRNGWRVFGANGNLQNFISCDASNNIDGFNIASTFNVFVGTDTNTNSANGYHFLTGATNNFGTLYSDASDVMGIRFDAGSAANIFTTVDSVTTIADAGSGNRWQGGNQPSANTWNMLEAANFRLWGATSGTNTISPAAISGSSMFNLPAALLTMTADTAAETVSIAIPNANVRLPQTAFVTSAYTNATTTFSTVTNQSFAVLANANYTLACHIYLQGSATTAGPKFQLTGPASPTAVLLSVNPFDPIAKTTTNVSSGFSTPNTTFGTIGALGVNYDVILSAGIVNGANAGTVVLQAAANGAGTLTIQPGSFCRFQ